MRSGKVCFSFVIPFLYKLIISFWDFYTVFWSQNIPFQSFIAIKELWISVDQCLSV